MTLCRSCEGIVHCILFYCTLFCIVLYFYFSHEGTRMILTWRQLSKPTRVIGVQSPKALPHVCSSAINSCAAPASLEAGPATNNVSTSTGNCISAFSPQSQLLSSTLAVADHHNPPPSTAAAAAVGSDAQMLVLLRRALLIRRGVRAFGFAAGSATISLPLSSSPTLSGASHAVGRGQVSTTASPAITCTHPLDAKDDGIGRDRCNSLATTVHHLREACRLQNTPAQARCVRLMLRTALRVLERAQTHLRVIEEGEENGKAAVHVVAAREERTTVTAAIEALAATAGLLTWNTTLLPTPQAPAAPAVVRDAENASSTKKNVEWGGQSAPCTRTNSTTPAAWTGSAASGGSRCGSTSMLFHQGPFGDHEVASAPPFSHLVYPFSSHSRSLSATAHTAAALDVCAVAAIHNQIALLLVELSTARDALQRLVVMTPRPFTTTTMSAGSTAAGGTEAVTPARPIPSTKKGKKTLLSLPKAKCNKDGCGAVPPPLPLLSLSDGSCLSSSAAPSPWWCVSLSLLATLVRDAPYSVAAASPVTARRWADAFTAACKHDADGSNPKNRDANPPVHSPTTNDSPCSPNIGGTPRVDCGSLKPLWLRALVLATHGLGGKLDVVGAAQPSVPPELLATYPTGCCPSGGGDTNINLRRTCSSDAVQNLLPASPCWAVGDQHLLLPTLLFERIIGEAALRSRRYAWAAAVVAQRSERVDSNVVNSVDTFSSQRKDHADPARDKQNGHPNVADSSQYMYDADGGFTRSSSSLPSVPSTSTNSSAPQTSTSVDLLKRLLTDSARAAGGQWWSVLQLLATGRGDGDNDPIGPHHRHRHTDEADRHHTPPSPRQMIAMLRAMPNGTGAAWRAALCFPLLHLAGHTGAIFSATTNGQKMDDRKNHHPFEGNHETANGSAQMTKAIVNNNNRKQKSKNEKEKVPHSPYYPEEPLIMSFSTLPQKRTPPLFESVMLRDRERRGAIHDSSVNDDVFIMEAVDPTQTSTDEASRAAKSLAESTSLRSTSPFVLVEAVRRLQQEPVWCASSTSSFAASAFGGMDDATRRVFCDPLPDSRIMHLNRLPLNAATTITTKGRRNGDGADVASGSEVEAWASHGDRAAATAADAAASVYESAIVDSRLQSLQRRRPSGKYGSAGDFGDGGHLISTQYAGTASPNPHLQRVFQPADGHSTTTTVGFHEDVIAFIQLCLEDQHHTSSATGGGGGGGVGSPAGLSHRLLEKTAAFAAPHALGSCSAATTASSTVSLPPSRESFSSSASYSSLSPLSASGRRALVVAAFMPALHRRLFQPPQSRPRHAERWAVEDASTLSAATADRNNSCVLHTVVEEAVLSALGSSLSDALTAQALQALADALIRFGESGLTDSDDPKAHRHATSYCSPERTAELVAAFSAIVTRTLVAGQRAVQRNAVPSPPPQQVLRSGSDSRHTMREDGQTVPIPLSPFVEAVLTACATALIAAAVVPMPEIRALHVDALVPPSHAFSPWQHRSASAYGHDTAASAAASAAAAEGAMVIVRGALLSRAARLAHNNAIRRAAAPFLDTWLHASGGGNAETTSLDPMADVSGTSSREVIAPSPKIAAMVAALDDDRSRSGSIHTAISLSVTRRNVVRLSAGELLDHYGTLVECLGFGTCEHAVWSMRWWSQDDQRRRLRQWLVAPPTNGPSSLPPPAVSSSSGMTVSFFLMRLLCGAAIHHTNLLLLGAPATPQAQSPSSLQRVSAVSDVGFVKLLTELHQRFILPPTAPPPTTTRRTTTRDESREVGNLAYSEGDGSGDSGRRGHSGSTSGSWDVDWAAAILRFDWYFSQHWHGAIHLPARSKDAAPLPPSITTSASLQTSTRAASTESDLDATPSATTCSSGSGVDEAADSAFMAGDLHLRSPPTAAAVAAAVAAVEVYSRGDTTRILQNETSEDITIANAALRTSRRAGPTAATEMTPSTTNPKITTVQAHVSPVSSTPEQDAAAEAVLRGVLQATGTAMGATGSPSPLLTSSVAMPPLPPAAVPALVVPTAIQRLLLRSVAAALMGPVRFTLAFYHDDPRPGGRGEDGYGGGGNFTSHDARSAALRQTLMALTAATTTSQHALLATTAHSTMPPAASAVSRKRGADVVVADVDDGVWQVQTALHLCDHALRLTRLVVRGIEGSTAAEIRRFDQCVIANNLFLERAPLLVQQVYGPHLQHTTVISDVASTATTTKDMDGRNNPIGRLAGEHDALPAWGGLFTAPPLVAKSSIVQAGVEGGSLSPCLRTLQVADAVLRASGPVLADHLERTSAAVTDAAMGLAAAVDALARGVAEHLAVWGARDGPFPSSSISHSSGDRGDNDGHSTFYPTQDGSPHASDPAADFFPLTERTSYDSNTPTIGTLGGANTAAGHPRATLCPSSSHAHGIYQPQPSLAASYLLQCLRPLLLPTHGAQEEGGGANEQQHQQQEQQRARERVAACFISVADQRRHRAIRGLLLGEIAASSSTVFAPAASMVHADADTNDRLSCAVMATKFSQLCAAATELAMAAASAGAKTIASHNSSIKLYYADRHHQNHAAGAATTSLTSAVSSSSVPPSSRRPDTSSISASASAASAAIAPTTTKVLSEQHSGGAVVAVAAPAQHNLNIGEALVRFNNYLCSGAVGPLFEALARLYETLDAADQRLLTQVTGSGGSKTYARSKTNGGGGGASGTLQNETLLDELDQLCMAFYYALYQQQHSDSGVREGVSMTVQRQDAHKGPHSQVFDLLHALFEDAAAVVTGKGHAAVPANLQVPFSTVGVVTARIRSVVHGIVNEFLFLDTLPTTPAGSSGHLSKNLSRAHYAALCSRHFVPLTAPSPLPLSSSLSCWEGAVRAYLSVVRRAVEGADQGFQIDYPPLHSLHDNSTTTSRCTTETVTVAAAAPQYSSHTKGASSGDVMLNVLLNRVMAALGNTNNHHHHHDDHNHHSSPAIPYATRCDVSLRLVAQARALGMGPVVRRAVPRTPSYSSSASSHTTSTGSAVQVVAPCPLSERALAARYCYHHHTSNIDGPPSHTIGIHAPRTAASNEDSGPRDPLMLETIGMLLELTCLQRSVPSAYSAESGGGSAGGRGDERMDAGNVTARTETIHTSSAIGGNPSLRSTLSATTIGVPARWCAALSLLNLVQQSAEEMELDMLLRQQQELRETSVAHGARLTPPTPTHDVASMMFEALVLNDDGESADMTTCSQTGETNKGDCGEKESDVHHSQFHHQQQQQRRANKDMTDALRLWRQRLAELKVFRAVLYRCTAAVHGSAPLLDLLKQSPAVAARCPAAASSNVYDLLPPEPEASELPSSSITSPHSEAAYAALRSAMQAGRAGRHPHHHRGSESSTATTAAAAAAMRRGFFNKTVRTRDVLLSLARNMHLHRLTESDGRHGGGNGASGYSSAWRCAFALMEERLGRFGIASLDVALPGGIPAGGATDKVADSVRCGGSAGGGARSHYYASNQRLQQSRAAMDRLHAERRARALRTLRPEVGLVLGSCFLLPPATPSSCGETHASTELCDAMEEEEREQRGVSFQQHCRQAALVRLAESLQWPSQHAAIPVPMRPTAPQSSMPASIRRNSWRHVCDGGDDKKKKKNSYVQTTSSASVQEPLPPTAANLPARTSNEVGSGSTTTQPPSNSPAPWLVAPVASAVLPPLSGNVNGDAEAACATVLSRVAQLERLITASRRRATAQW